MNIVNTLLFSTLFLFVVPSAKAQMLQGCAAKQQNIKNKIEHAQARDNTNEILGLQKALTETTEHCHDSNLKVQREQKYLEKQRKVAKIEAELLKATESGNQTKIIKKRKKLENAQQELEVAKRRLDSN